MRGECYWLFLFSARLRLVVNNQNFKDETPREHIFFLRLILFLMLYLSTFKVSFHPMHMVTFLQVFEKS